MKDKELRKLIGSRVKQRRLELNLTQPYVAEKMGVTASTILRYENGSIDNTKKMVLEGLSEALHVSVEWLKGETDEYETDITDKRELQIRDAMGDILEQLPLALTKEEDAFSKDLLLLMLKQYGLFLDSFQFACKKEGDWRLEDCTLYVTLEPCPMCAGAIVQARIPRVVIGSMNSKAGCAGSVLNLLKEPGFNHQAQVVTGILEEECSEMMSGFFTELRKKKRLPETP